MKVSRTTAQGVPRYAVDNDGHPEDRFILAGAEELVPVGNGIYRPRTDVHFWRIEQKKEGWTVTTKDGTRYWLGSDGSARVADEGRGGILLNLKSDEQLQVTDYGPAGAEIWRATMEQNGLTVAGESS